MYRIVLFLISSFIAFPCFAEYNLYRNAEQLQKSRIQAETAERLYIRARETAINLESRLNAEKKSNSDLRNRIQQLEEDKKRLSSENTKLISQLTQLNHDRFMADSNDDESIPDQDNNEITSVKIKFEKTEIVLKDDHRAETTDSLEENMEGNQ